MRSNAGIILCLGISNGTAEAMPFKIIINAFQADLIVLPILGKMPYGLTDTFFTALFPINVVNVNQNTVGSSSTVF